LLFLQKTLPTKEIHCLAERGPAYLEFLHEYRLWRDKFPYLPLPGENSSP
jgi:hypothetical protein